MADLTEFWIDVGGTFTDCLMKSPDGRLSTFKVLSSGITKGRVTAVLNDRSLRDDARIGDAPHFWIGYTLTLLDNSGNPIQAARVVEFEAATGAFTLDEPLVHLNQITVKPLASSRPAGTVVPSPRLCGERARVRGFDDETTSCHAQHLSPASASLNQPSTISNPPESKGPLTLTLSPQSRGEGTRQFNSESSSTSAPHPSTINLQSLRYELSSGEEAPILAIRTALGLRLDEAIPPVVVRLGTTRGTNALLTRRGAKVGFVTTQGFRDVLLIANQDRPQLFDLAIHKPEPLFAAVAEIDERLDATGHVLLAPEESAVRERLRELKAAGCESLAICLLHAFANPAHELLIARIAQEIGFTEISTSSRLSPLIKIVSRGDTTVMDAYVNPILRDYIGKLRGALEKCGVRNAECGIEDNDSCHTDDAPLHSALRTPNSALKMMTSAGGLVDADRFTGKDSVLSGPAGGVIGFSRVAQRAGFAKSIGFDMGGTSTDVSRFDGRYEREFETTKAGVRVVAPMLAIETVAAGGGSVCGFDGVKLFVGPQSAGANPGPACYGRGGPLTITDVNFFLGKIIPERFPFPLDRAAVETRLAELCDHVAQSPLGRSYSPHELAQGFIDIANTTMARAIRKISVSKGYDPAEYALVTFGGAGAQHACALALSLGMTTVLSHPYSGVLSAYGIGLADVRQLRERGVLKPFSPEVLAELEPHFVEMADSAQAAVLTEGIPADRIDAPIRSLDLRYRGIEASLNVIEPVDDHLPTGLAQQHETVPTGLAPVESGFCPTPRSSTTASSSPTPSSAEDSEPPGQARWGRLATQYARAYAARHQQLYGYTRPDRPIEIVAARIEVVGHRPDPDEAPLNNRQLDNVVASLPPSPRRGGPGRGADQHRTPQPQSSPLPNPPPQGEGTGIDDATRQAHSHSWTETWFGGRPHRTAVFLREQLHPGDTFPGPAIVCEPTSTVVIDPGFEATIRGRGEIVIARPAATVVPSPQLCGERARVRGFDEVTTSDHVERSSPASLHQPSTIDHQPSSEEPLTLTLSPQGRGEGTGVADPIQIEIFNHLFASIAEQMGIALQQTSLSTNVKERLDFSCGIFSARGELVVNAPHIPVHLGAMSETVRRIIEDNPSLQPGDVFVTNDPYRGGSHLPDVTVVTPVHDESTDELMFFTASRAHHAEIGGIVPGSMPPFSKTLADEGVLIRNFLLVEGRGLRVERLQQTISHESDLRDLLTSSPWPSRSPDDNIADVSAQVAANQTGATQLRQLVEKQTWPVVRAYMGHIQASAAAKMRLALSSMPDGEYSRTDHLDDGSPICVTITIEGDRATVDFTGTGPVLATNLNANRAIVTAAVLYVFRCLIQDDIPLNSGVLEPVTIVLPECLLNPPAHEDPAQCAAMVGGNVETSQRVVDVLLGALGVAAASQGTMNNLTFGDGTFGYYETICGGSGATPDADGADAVHTHMTNTRLTDPEVIERRYPVRIHEFSIRRGSGGAGQHRGGDGIVRKIEFLKPLKVSLLTERRGSFAPFGLSGGEPGSLGRNTLQRAGSTEIIDLGGKVSLDVQAGDVLTIETPGGGGYGLNDQATTD